MGPSTALASKTATASFQRFTTTFIHGGGALVLYAVRAPGDPGTAANIEVVDAELYLGSSDLNPAPLKAKPLAVQNRDIVLGVNAFDSRISVADGEWVSGAPGLIQLGAAENPKAYTYAYLIKPAAPNFTSLRTMLACVGSRFKALSMGFSTQGFGFSNEDGGAGGSYYNNVNMDTLPPSSLSPSTGALPKIGYGYCVVVQSYDGKTPSMYINGLKIAENPKAVPPPTGISALSVGGIWNSNGIFGGKDPRDGFFQSGFNIRRLVRWDRKLTDAEVLQTTKAMSADVTLGKQRLMICMGDSELGNIYTDGANYHAATPRIAINYHQDATVLQNHELPPIVGFVDNMLGGEVAFDEYILMMFIGTNNIANSPNNPNDAVRRYTAYIDHRRATCATKGRTLKTICVTLLPRFRNGTAAKAQFNADRAAFNKALVSGLGGRINALVRLDQDPIFGPDAASDNATLFPDATHPDPRLFKPVFIPLLVSAINSLG